MSPTQEQVVAALRKTLADNAELRRRLEAGSAPHEPIAVIGMAARLPGGVDSAEALWRLVSEQVDAVTAAPTDRGWDPDAFRPAGSPSGAEPAPAVSAYGGWLHDAADFDYEFFGISPREALTMDPQQRQFLEVSWEAVEHAGIDPRKLRDSDTGVWGGVMFHDYAGHRAGSFLSGRVAYTLGLQGPAVSVDTACSSSLVAVHQACASLRSGETSLALAGGATVMSTTDMLAYFADQGGLAPDGRCRAYAADADGTGLAEGVGVLVLERLVDARRLGHPVWAVLRGSAVNSDGASSSMVTPNGPAQQRVILAALSDAGLRPADVDLIEGHGTGTRLGDPIEVQALLATYGQGRPADRPAHLGSVKSNLGHTQAAAGVAGLIKIIQAIRYATLPATVHVPEPSPQVDWTAGAVRLLRQSQPWPHTAVRRAAVSSFGLSGTNAHVVVEQAPEDLAVPVRSVRSGAGPDPADGSVPLVLSARTPAALRAVAARVAGRLRDGADVRGVAGLLGSRTPLEHRTVVWTADGQDRLARLDAVAEGRVADPARIDRPATVGLVFGSPAAEGWLALGEQRWDHPEFRRGAETVLAALPAGAAEPARAALQGRSAGPDVRDAAVLAALAGLVSELQAWGIAIGAATGTGFGAVAAALVTQAITPADALGLLRRPADPVEVRPTDGVLLLADLNAAVAATTPPQLVGERGRDRVWVQLGAVSGPDLADLVLRPSADGVEPLAAALWCAGAPLDWSVPIGPYRYPADGVPSYPFQHESLWWSAAPAGARELGLDAVEHPVLTTCSVAPGGETVLTGRVSALTPGWAGDHRVGGQVVFPGTGWLDLALAAGQVCGGIGVEELVLRAPLALTTAWTRLRLVVDCADPAGRRDLTVFAEPASGAGDGWVTHATGVLGPVPTSATAAPDWPPADAPVDLTDLYAGLDRRGLSYGPALRCTRAAWDDGAATWVEVGRSTSRHDADPPYAIRPDLLDACFHAALAAAGERAEVPFVWRAAWVAPGAGHADRLRARIGRDGEHGLSLLVWDESGRPVAGIGAVAGRHAATPSAAADAERSPVDGLSRGPWITRWEPSGPAAPVDDAVVVIDAPVVDPLPAVLAAVQAVVAAGDRALVLTHGACAVEPTELPDPDQAAVAGLVRSAELEAPGTFVLLDLASGEPTPELTLPPGEPEVAVRNGRHLVPRWQAANPTPTGPDAVRIVEPVLVTGGGSGVGAALARHLVQAHGVRELVLVSRRATSHPAARALAAALQQQGARTELADADVTTLDWWSGLAAGRRFGTVVHAAGVLDDASIGALTPDRLDPVLRTKAGALAALDAALPPEVALIAISSVAAAVGSSGQAAYAAANAAGDAVIARRRARGGAGVALQLGPWTVGMGADLDPEQRAAMAAAGVPLVEPAVGLELVDAALAGGAPVQAPVLLDPVAVAARRQLPALLRAYAPRRAAGPADGAAATVATASVAPDLAGLDPEGRRTRLVEIVRRAAADTLGFRTVDRVDPERSLGDYGFDSVSAVEFRGAVSRAVGLRLPATLVFDHPTVHAIVDLVLAELPVTATATPSAVVPAAAAAAASAVARPGVVEPEPIAIVGMACHFPGADDPDALWRLVSDGVDATGEFPTDRGWDPAVVDPAGGPGRSRTGRGAFLYDAALFDADFFGISPREALDTDPQHRLLLQTCWEALEHAGIAPAGLRRSRTGVYAGVMYHDYPAGSAGSMMAGRVSYTLGLQGPSLSVDTACSSSLVALHLAGQALLDGECDLALAGGVTVMATPRTFVDMTEQGGLAADGRCKPYGAAADGTGWGEGAGVLVVERLSAARAHGHRVYGLIRGSAVNSDGASTHFSAPNGPAQQQVIRAALERAGLAASEVELIEGHGTGTALGDPIEAQALLATYGRDRSTPAWLGSIKSNIGHAQAAAGVAGVIKVVQALRHGQLPRSLHGETPSEHVDWDAGSVRLLTENRPWSGTGPRRAGVSSFGIAGTNAHLVLEQAPADLAPDMTADGGGGVPVSLVLSARTPTALRALAGRLHAIVLEVAPRSLARALAARTPFDRRAVVQGCDRQQLRDGLAALAAGQPADGLCTGQVGDAPDAPTGPDPLARARAWCHGRADDWAAEVTDAPWPFGWVPTYAFDRTPYWTAPRPAAGTDLGHPVLAATVDLPEGDRSVAVGTLSTSSPAWTADHVVAGTVLYPGTGLVDLALTAGRAAGAPRLTELLVHAPLPLAVTPAQVRVSVAGSGPERTVQIHTRTGGADWVCHASGRLGPAAADPAEDLLEWPPPGAVEVDVRDAYPELERLGYAYGPRFRGLRRGWRDGEVRYAEVELPPGAWTAGHLAHPALVDAALHVGLLDLGARDDTGGVLLPFAWTDVQVTGSLPPRVRVRIGPGDGPDALTLLVADESGRPRLRVGALASRPLRSGSLPPDRLWSLGWRPCRPDAAIEPGPRPMIDAGALLGGSPDDVLLRLGAVADRLLPLLQARLLDPEPCLVLTRDAVDRPGAAPDPVQAAVWGLVRAAEAENPGSFVLVDRASGDEVAVTDVPAGVTEVVRRDGGWSRPVLTPVPPADPVARPDFGAGPVLVTGGTGGIGRRLAQHLVQRHGVTELVLVSRRGPEAAGCRELVRDLGAAGATVHVVAADLTDRGEVAGLFDRFAITGIVHCAGVAENGLVAGLTPASVRRVLAAKAAVGWSLHQASLGRDVASFVIISSAGGLVMPAGQGGYSAANVFCDALAEHRRALGLPARSLAFGLWDLPDGMAAELTDTDRARLVAAGTPPIPAADALQLFDHALAADAGTVVPLILDRSALARRVSAGGPLPAVLTGLVAAASRPTAPSVPPPPTSTTADFAVRLGRLGRAARRRALEDLVRSLVASTLRTGTGADGVDPQQSFESMGFDSLASVELRNQVSEAVGLRLPPTFAFDHPDVMAVVGYLERELTSAGPVDERVDDGALETVEGLGGGAALVLDDDLAAADVDELVAILDRELGRVP